MQVSLKNNETEFAFSELGTKSKYLSRMLFMRNHRKLSGTADIFGADRRGISSTKINNFNSGDTIMQSYNAFKYYN